MKTNVEVTQIDNVWEQVDLGLHVVMNDDGGEVVVNPQVHICINQWSRMIVDYRLSICSSND